MKCSVCGQEAASYSMGERRYEPCGHIDNSPEALRSSKAAKDTIGLLNQIWAEMTGSARSRHTYNWWSIPRNWKGTRYRFGYTPWETQYNGKRGFFAVKYRLTQKGGKLVKAIRFGKRKTARQRSLQWYDAYYRSQKPAAD